MQLQTEIEIDAPTERVWAALVELDSYEEWNPFIRRVSGALSPEQQLDITLTAGDGSEWTIRATLVAIDAPRELVWRSKKWFRGLFDVEHSFRLLELGAARTRFVNGEQVTGLLVQYRGNHLTQVARGLVAMNQALKRRVEARP